jgi:hypothetical protein
MKIIFALSASAMLFGCAVVGLYPVQGPLSTQKPLPVYTVKIASDNTISVVLANGEFCKGQWTRGIQPTPSAAETTIHDAATMDMTAVWDRVYGVGFYTAKVLGHETWAVLIGDKGTVLNVRFINEGDHPLTGVASDSRGNIFKLT